MINERARNVGTGGQNFFRRGLGNRPYHTKPEREQGQLEGRPQEIDVSKTAGRLGFFKANLENITDDQFVLECISGCKIDFEQLPLLK